MRVSYDWDPNYSEAEYWDARTPLHLGMPRFFHAYQDLNDKKLRVFLSELKGKLLDAGCGNGRFVAYTDVGVDFSKRMLRQAKNVHRERSFIRASVINLPFKDKGFEVAFTIDVLLHIPPEKRKDALEELERVSNNCYNFLAEHRTITPFILEFFRTVSYKPLWWIIPYIAVFFAFPIDRIRNLKIDSTLEVLKKMRT